MGLGWDLGQPLTTLLNDWGIVKRHYFPQWLGHLRP
jgi:hypothetical protein